MILYILLCFLFLQADSAKYLDRSPLKKNEFNADPEEISLAVQETFIIPIFNAINTSIQFIPSNSLECTLKESAITYKMLHQKSFATAQNSVLTSILVLKKHNEIMTIDQNFYLSIHEIVNNTSIKQIASSIPVLKSIQNNINSSPILVTNQNQTMIYIISNQGYFFFSSISYSTDIKKVHTPETTQIFDAKIFAEHLYVAAGTQGIYVYQIQTDFTVKLINTIKLINCVQIQIDRYSKLLYGLDHQKGIFVYNLSGVPLKISNHDEIKLNISKYDQFKIYSNVIIIRFAREMKNIIAEYSYNAQIKQIVFIRYIKLRTNIQQMHLFDKNAMIIGHSFIGLIPLNIHPKLVPQNFNGYFDITNIHKIAAYNLPYFIGISRHYIYLGEIQTSNYQNLHCRLEQNTKLKKIIYKANLSSCDMNLDTEYYQYCEYQKQFIVKKMDIVAHVEIAMTIIIIAIVCVILILIGIAVILIMRKRKMLAIRKLEQQYEQKRKTIVPPSSERGGTQVLKS